MKEIKAFKCSYCGEIDSDKSSCSSHEKKCCHNPSTKSCESCAFCGYTAHFVKNLRSEKIPICLKNEDISFSFKKYCIHYKSRNSSSVSRIIDAVLTKCNITGQVERYLSVPF